MVGVLPDNHGAHRLKGREFKRPEGMRRIDVSLFRLETHGECAPFRRREKIFDKRFPAAGKTLGRKIGSGKFHQ